MPRTAIFVSNRGFGLTRSRIPLMRAMSDRGWTVVAVCARDDSVQKFEAYKVAFEPVDFARRAFAPRVDLFALSRLRSIYRTRTPSLIHHFNAKPVILGRFAVKSTDGHRPKIISTVTGLGYAFSRGGLVSRLANTGFRMTLPQSEAVVFQNRDDLALGVERGWVNPARARLILSSGVDTTHFTPEPEITNGKQTVLFVGRLLREKGIGEFIEVAKRVREMNPAVIFAVVGELEPSHPDAFPEVALREAVSGGYIEFLGYAADMRRILRGVSILLMPSYREGVPRVVLEAAACGIPVVGADVPGTREAVVDGVTGFLVPRGDVATMAARVEELIGMPAKRMSFGMAGRAFMEREFDTSVVTQRYLDLYEEILGRDF